MTRDSDARHDQLDRFLAGVEKRALRMAEIAVGNRDDALDIVQDAMLALARRYARRPAGQWPPLFYRILENRIRDCLRRRATQRRHLAPPSQDENGADPIDNAAAPASADPAAHLGAERALARLEAALGGLPARQRQVFMLRIWEQLDVAASARAMGCSAGSVKTHLSRALSTLRRELANDWP